MGLKLFNQIGIGLCFTGTLIIFIWGAPQPSFSTGVGIAVSDNTPIDDTGKTAKEHDLEVEKKRNLYSCMSKLGIILIMVGFVFQFVATKPRFFQRAAD